MYYITIWGVNAIAWLLMSRWLYGCWPWEYHKMWPYTKYIVQEKRKWN